MKNILINFVCKHFPLSVLSKTCEVLGWSISIPKCAEDDPDLELPGLIIGTNEYIDFILSHLPDDVDWNKLWDK